MQNTDDIIKAYKLADFERRLFLFLEHRDLREMFTEIDENELFFDYQLQESRKGNAWLSKVKRAAVLKWLPI